MGKVEDADAAKNKGNDFFKAKDYPKAIEWYSKAIELNPDKVYYSNRSVAYNSAGNYDLAIADGKAAIALDKYWVKGYFRCATAEKNAGLFMDAMYTINEGLKSNGDDADLTSLKKAITPDYERQVKEKKSKMSGPEALKEEGNELFKAAKFEEAVAVYTKVIDMIPHAYGEVMGPVLMSAYNNRAACYQQLGLYRQVTEDSSIVLEQDPTNVKALLRRGLALESLDKFRAALQDIRAVLAIDPTIDMANKAQHRIGAALRTLEKSGK